MGRTLPSAAANARKVQDVAPVDYTTVDSEMAPVMRSLQRRAAATQAVGSATNDASTGLENMMHDAKGWGSKIWQGMKNGIMGPPLAPAPPPVRTNAQEAADYKDSMSPAGRIKYGIK